jgi:phenylacetate-CoA ligase
MTSTWKQRVYGRLPAPLRSVAASWHGWRLQRLRYGRDLDRRVEIIHERESWDRDAWSTWRAETLSRRLVEAREHVPHYRGLGLPADASLEDFPILEKRQVRSSEATFRDERFPVRELVEDHTSGSTGTPLDLWWSPDAVRDWYALVHARMHAWYDLNLSDAWGMLGGQLIVPATVDRPPFWVWNAGMRQLYLSVYHLSPAHLPHYVRALERHRVRYLLGYPSALYELARGILNGAGSPPPMRVIFTNSEPLWPHQRAAVEAAFECPVVETYGMAEVVTAASQCPSGGLHLWPEAGHLELLEDGHAVPAGRSGEVIGTGLLNPAMPFIRYRVGDRAILKPTDASCPCGRRLPLLEAIEGRSDDVLRTPDGRTIGRLDPVFKGGLPIVEAQIVQDRLDHMWVRYVPEGARDTSVVEHIRREIEARMPGVQVDFDALTRIPRDARGKFRAVISELNGRANGGT